MVLGACLGAAASPALAAAAGPPATAAEAPAGLHLASFRAPSAITAGDRAAISGRVAPAAGVPVLIERLEGDAWRTIATVRTGRGGRFSADLPLRRSSNLRASVQAPDGTLQTSRRRFVTLRRRVTLSVTMPQYTNISGMPFTVRGSVRPAAGRERVALEGSVDGKRFRVLRRFVARGGRVRATFTPPSGGRWRFRLVADAHRGIDGGGRASVPAIPVFGSNPHGVLASAPFYLVQAISETQLYVYEHAQLTRVFPVVFGKPSTPTPVGRFAVYSKTTGPSPAFGPLVLWYHRGYGIHGTNQEYLLARPPRYYSHGCTRNYNTNIRWLWPLVPVGTPVLNLA
jgi:hypothetical protein